MPTSNGFRIWVPHLLLCLVTAVTVSATAYLCAWANYRNNLHQHSISYLTRVDLELLREEIEAYKKRTGDWPARLADLKVVKDKRWLVDEKGQPLDRWGWPFQYRVEAGGYVLCSFG